MLTEMRLLRAMNIVREVYVLDTIRALDLLNDWAQPRRSRRRLWRMALIAALLSLLLAACGYAVYRATMEYRELRPDDEMRYYLNARADEAWYEERGMQPQQDMMLNHGECALALHFDTEEEGVMHAFRVGGDNGLDHAWHPGLFSPPTLKSRLEGFTPEAWELQKSWPTFVEGTEPINKPRPLSEILRLAGVSEEEAEKWYCSMSYFDESGSLKLRIDLFNGPMLYGHDLICGWPKGEAAIIKDEHSEDTQVLEAQVDIEFLREEREQVNYYFAFYPQRQCLLVLMAHPEDMDFAAMEKCADSIEILDTGFTYKEEPSLTNWSVLAFANG